MKEGRPKTARSQARELLSKSDLQDASSYEVVHIQRKSFKNLIAGCFVDLIQDQKLHNSSSYNGQSGHQSASQWGSICLIDLEKRFSRKRSLDLDLSVHSLLKFSRNDMLRLHIWRRREDPQISQQPSLAVSRHRAQHSRISTLYHLPAISQLHTPCEEPHAFKLRQASSPCSLRPVWIYSSSINLFRTLSSCPKTMFTLPFKMPRKSFML